MTLEEIKALVDQAVLDLWPKVENWQNSFLGGNGRYWQGRRTHSVLPAEGNKTPPDVGTSAPPDCPPWPLTFRNEVYPMALEVHAYRGPQGIGYVVHIGVTAEGETWYRSVQVGPETWRAHDWLLRPPGPPL